MRKEEKNMKQYLIILGVVLAFAACQSENGQPSGIQEIPSNGKKVSNADLIKIPVTAEGVQDQSTMAKFEFEETEFDFGTIPEGKVINHSFRFKNVGEVPLQITSCRSTCGCTIPKWPREPIMPGESGKIDVRFNSETKIGPQNKPVTLTANTYPSDTQIYIKGTVEKDKP